MQSPKTRLAIQTMQGREPSKDTKSKGKQQQMGSETLPHKSQIFEWLVVELKSRKLW